MGAERERRKDRVSSTPILDPEPHRCACSCEFETYRESDGSSSWTGNDFTGTGIAAPGDALVDDTLGPINYPQGMGGVLAPTHHAELHEPTRTRPTCRECARRRPREHSTTPAGYPRSVSRLGCR